ncbi:hypothetical protein [Saccharopolyspora rosea]|uniref:Uncharacterized protein n=1 Tax=Saccharopolyspora rosea TaxID=524884 RepID=A0ABW3FK90_9PSEU|nr:hypothetical protein [Saccharopolyspora rosea]
MKTTVDPETPIFGELQQELGELPNIDIHDFDQHAFDFLREEQEPVKDEVVVADSSAGSRRGGRRRKER